MCVVTAASSVPLAVAVGLVATPLLGQIAAVLAAIVGALSAYTVSTTPRRYLERAALVEASEAPTLAASGAVYLHATASKTKTVLLLRSDEPQLSSVLSELKKDTLLGLDPQRSLQRLEHAVGSDSTLRILRSIVRAQGERLRDEGEELESVVRSSASGEETKFPVFLTISFFLPIMLMIFAAMEHHTSLISVASLAFLEIVVLDLALSVSSTERRKLSA